MNGVAYSIAGLIIGYLIKYGLDKRQQFIAKNAEIKRIAYSELVVFILDTMSQDKIGKMSNKNMAVRLNSFYSKYILYASQEVVIAYADLMQYIYKNSTMDSVITTKLMTKVFKFMRKDIGLRNYMLGSDGELLLRAKFNDFDNLFEVKKDE